MTQIADRYAGLAGGFLDRITATPADRWDAPSPCSGWAARDVVAHVINGHRGIIAIARGTRPVAAGGVGVSGMAEAPPVSPGADLGAVFGAVAAELADLLNDPALAARRLPGGPLGAVPVAQAADLIGALELLVHTWDLARATGGDEKLDPEAAARTHLALLPYRDGLQATGAFLPGIEAPDGADPQTAFLYFTGRRP
jgi:uncharacterized protein (TIGR03086 family)